MMPIKHQIKYSIGTRTEYGKRFSHCLVCGAEILNTSGTKLMCWTCWSQASRSLRIAAIELLFSTSIEGAVAIGSLKEE